MRTFEDEEEKLLLSVQEKKNTLKKYVEPGYTTYQQLLLLLHNTTTTTHLFYVFCESSIKYTCSISLLKNSMLMINFSTLLGNCVQQFITLKNMMHMYYLCIFTASNGKVCQEEKSSSTLGASKWINQVLIIKKTSNENVLELFFSWQTFPFAVYYKFELVRFQFKAS